MGLLKQLFGLEPKPDLKAIYQQGAQVIDVRSPGEFASGHFEGSINIPLGNLPNHIGQVNKSKPVITVCASGMRSEAARALFAKAGFETYNGGGWTSFRNKVR